MHVPELRTWPRLARLLADGTRASFCLALLYGRAWTAAELARHAGVPASSGNRPPEPPGGRRTSLAQERQGRHRYVRLADAGTAELVESLASMAPPYTAQPGSLSVASHNQALARARTCYDHPPESRRLEHRGHDAPGADSTWGGCSTLTSKGSCWFAALRRHAAVRQRGARLPATAATGPSAGPAPGRYRPGARLGGHALGLPLDHPDRHRPGSGSHRRRARSAAGAPRPRNRLASPGIRENRQNRHACGTALADHLIAECHDAPCRVPCGGPCAVWHAASSS